MLSGILSAFSDAAKCLQGCLREAVPGVSYLGNPRKSRAVLWRNREQLQILTANPTSEILNLEHFKLNPCMILASLGWKFWAQSLKCPAIREFT